MALSADDLLEIDALLAAPDAGARALPELRRRFPDLSLTCCEASDVDAELPFREYRQFTLYLVDAADHCWRLTPDPARATGLVVAQNRVNP